MTEELKFKTVDVGFDIFDDLNKKRTLKKSTVEIIKAAHNRGGYVAGGFATILARHYLLNRPGDDADEDHDLYAVIRSHLGQPKSPDGTRFCNAGCGDIDVWFPDYHALDAFMYTRQSLMSNVAPDVEENRTLTGAAVELLIPGESRIQVITKWVQPIEEQLAGFDIYNAMVAIKGGKITVPEHWEQLESDNVLHVSQWKSSWTMNRLFKWINRKRWYKSTTPATSEHVYRKLMKLVEWKQKWPNFKQNLSEEQLIKAITQDKLKRRVLAQDAFHMQKFLGPIISGLTGSQLLELSAFFPEPIKYDISMQEIHKRMPPI